MYPSGFHKRYIYLNQSKENLNGHNDIQMMKLTNLVYNTCLCKMVYYTMCVLTFVTVYCRLSREVRHIFVANLNTLVEETKAYDRYHQEEGAQPYAIFICRNKKHIQLD